MAAVICWLFHRRYWWSRTSTYYGVKGFDEAEQVEQYSCRRCHRTWERG